MPAPGTKTDTPPSHTSWVPLLARFRRDERGMTAVIFGVLFAVLFLMTAIVVDFTRAWHEQSREQSAVDAAALAASHYLGLEDQDTTGPLVAQRFFKENLGQDTTANLSVQLNAAAGTVNAQVSNSLATTLLSSVTQDHIRTDHLDLGARSTVIKGSGTIEVAMVLDNSGSMCTPCTKIDALKQAANNLIGIVFAGAEGTDDVKMSVIPFAASVNVGSGNQGSGWIYQGAEDARSYPLFEGSESRFDMFGRLGQSWAGCVEARPAPYDVTDSVADADNPNSMFAPMFAPDEPDSGNSEGKSYTNSYISDFGGTCPTPEQVCVAYKTVKGVKSCKTWGPAPIPARTAQDRSCKYANSGLSSTGPNWQCTTPALLPLTDARADVEDAIDGLVTSGNTNIAEGAAWGWRTLSPTAPFVEGRSYGDQENRKVLIVMTDGDNVLNYRDNQNRSVYSAYGYASQERLSATYSGSAYSSGLNTKTLSVCNNAKAEQITVYTVAFGTDISTAGQNLLRQCATSNDHAFIALDETALVQAFQQIGREIAKLRVAS